MQIRLVLAVLAVVFLDWGGSAQAADATVKAQVSVTFTTSERQVIREYYQQAAPPAAESDCAGLPPGQAKKRGCGGGLPPGIAKNYARGKPLPPGIARRSLPQDLQARLPERPGYVRVVVDNDVLLVDSATNLVVDVLRGIIANRR